MTIFAARHILLLNIGRGDRPGKEYVILTVNYMVKNNMYSGETLRRMSGGGTRFGVEKGREIRHGTTVPTMAETVSPGNCGEGCGERSGSKWGLDGYPLAMVYAPLQNFCALYEPEKGLSRGTIFSQLDLPLKCVGHHGRGGVNRNG